MKLYASMLRMTRPSPHAAANTKRAATRILIGRSLVDRNRGRQRDGALGRERVAVSEESDVEADRPESNPAAESELHVLALIARDAAAQRERARALLDADVNGGAPPRIDDVRTHRRPRPHPQ